MSESAHRFGRARHLVGVAGQPDGTPGPVGVILLNAGLVPRVGPFRLHVSLARHLNALGYATLRFDLSNLGDSGVDDGARSREKQVAADVADAMQLLAEHSGRSRFVLIGLCSGAANAHAVACEHPDVAGAVFLDGYAYTTLGFRLRHYLPKLLRTHPLRVLKSIKRRVQATRQGQDPLFAVEFPPRMQVVTELADMLDRGLKLYFVYSGGASGYFNHVRQFRECFGAIALKPGVRVSYFEQADHTYVLSEDRKALAGVIGDWMQQQFPV